jgi:hypothetical protein
MYSVDIELVLTLESVSERCFSDGNRIGISGSNPGMYSVVGLRKHVMFG